MPTAPRDFSRSGTLYSVLGVTSDSSTAEIKAAYRRLAYKLHPDRRRAGGGGGSSNVLPGSPSKADAEFALVASAYEVLSDEQKRDIYDAFGSDALRLQEWIQSLMPSSSSTPWPLPPVLLLAVLVSGGALVLLLLAIFLVLAAFHRDRILPSAVPLPLVFAPLLLATTLLSGLRALVSANGPSDLRPSLLRQLPSAVLMLAFEGLLCSRLIGQLEPFAHPDDLVPWLWVVSPLLVACGLAMSDLPTQLHQERRAAARAGAAITDAAAATAAAWAANAAAFAASQSGDQQPADDSNNVYMFPSGAPAALGGWAVSEGADAMLGGKRRLLGSSTARQLALGFRRRSAWLRAWLLACMDIQLLACARRLLWLLAAALQISLVPPRLEGLIHCRWRLLLLPTWLWLALEFGLTAASCWHFARTGIRRRRGGVATSYDRRGFGGTRRGSPGRKEASSSSAAAGGGGGGGGGGWGEGGQQQPPADFFASDGPGRHSYAYDDEEEEASPREQLRHSLSQWGRGLRLTALVAIALILSWGCGAADAAEAYRAPAAHLMMPPLLAMLFVVSCATCACCSAPSPRHAATRAWERELRRRHSVDRRAAMGEASADASGAGIHIGAATAAPPATSAPPAAATPRGEEEGLGEGLLGGGEEASSFTPRRQPDDVDPDEVVAAALREFAPGTPLPGLMPEPEPEPRHEWELAFEGLEEEEALARTEQAEEEPDAPARSGIDHRDGGAG